jgi:hypothetical protein
MGAWHPSGRAKVSARSPRALGVCDSCGFTYNLVDLRPRQQWTGMKIQTFNQLVCRTCWDIPQPQLRTIIIPPDPIPVYNPRPERYTSEVPSYMAEESSTFAGIDLTTEDGKNLIHEIQDVPSPTPELPVIYPLVPGPYS